MDANFYSAILFMEWHIIREQKILHLPYLIRNVEYLKVFVNSMVNISIIWTWGNRNEIGQAVLRVYCNIRCPYYVIVLVS